MAVVLGIILVNIFPAIGVLVWFGILGVVVTYVDNAESIRRRQEDAEKK
jgi:hypothetical protein